VRAPYPPSRLKISDMDDVHTYFKEILNQQFVPFYDLNYNSSKVILDNDFEDYHHMNSFGAKKASFDLAEIIVMHDRTTHGQKTLRR